MLDVIYYARPNGRPETITMTNIEETEVVFFKNDYVVSLEELTTGDVVVYARPSELDDEDLIHDDKDEVLVMSRGRKCEAVMKELRELCEKTFGRS